MQTLKTAAIVVLLMTVMYGAYVSLTTPPEPLPDEVEQMLVMGDESTLALDAGLPASLGELEINSGTPDPVAVDASDAPTFAAFDSAGPTHAGTFASPIDSVNPGSSDGQVFAGEVDTTGGVVAQLSDSATPVSAVDVSPAGVVAASAQTPQSYPQTSNTFELPDPNDVAKTFGTATAAPAESDLALASGTSDPRSLQATAEHALSSVPSSVDRRQAGIGLANAIRTADRQYASDRRRDALATLSLFYNTPDLSGEQRSEMLSRLDPLAREVIYSKRHLLEQPYRVGQNETLMQVAVRYEVPWQLLANINQIEDPITILPGTELKVVKGPFRAEVNLTQKELTLFLGDLYAGRFPVGIGNDPPPRPGTFTIQDKQTSKTFYDQAGSPIPPGSPDNPYGDIWLDLGGQLCIHGSPSTTSPTVKGCVSLAADYADDLYGILSQGSVVTIRR